MMRNGCYVAGFIYSEISVVWGFVFMCYLIPFFLQSRHMDIYFSNLAVYHAWVSQLVSYLLLVKRWIFVKPWLPARSCLQLMSSLVVFSFWCVLEGDSIFIFKTTFLSFTVSQGIISLFHHHNMTVLNVSFMTVLYPNFSQNVSTLLLNTLQLAIQRCKMQYASLLIIFWLFFLILLSSREKFCWLFKFERVCFPDQPPFLFLDLDKIQVLCVQIKKPWSCWSQISEIWPLNHYMQPHGRNVIRGVAQDKVCIWYLGIIHLWLWLVIASYHSYRNPMCPISSVYLSFYSIGCIS